MHRRSSNTSLITEHHIRSTRVYITTLLNTLAPTPARMASDSELPNGTADSSRRKSGRVSRRPDVFAEEDHAGSLLTSSSTKRKRVTSEIADDLDTDEDDSEDDDDESEPDEEELREKRRNQKKRTQADKPATKRARPNPAPRSTLAIRSANVPSKPASKSAKAQKARARQSQAHKEGLYAEVFGRGQNAEDAATHWISLVRKDSVAAIRDLVNMVFECIGCEIKITSPDIEDIDNVPGKLGDVLEEQYAQKQPAEYPLISKSKQYSEFKTVLTEFFDALIKALHNSTIFHEQPEVYDNIHVWVGTMSGAQYRPFRHTATVISLAMSTALCDVAAEILQSTATTKTQIETEKKKKGTNKARIAALQDKVKSEDQKLETVDAALRDAFDTVYVHRYRDVDEKIRVECVAALGSWIVKYRKMFLEGQYLRYLGWVMSDPSSPTRLEVVRQIKVLFGQKRNVSALRAFTDRFRSRMVEMGARDADVNVRVESIELLDKLRNYELLEPDDIDTIGRLIFDAEPRIRKTVGKFFVSNIEDLYKALTEDWEDEQYAEALPTLQDADDQMEPNQGWIKFKCLAQTLSSYDAKSESEEHPEDTIRTLANTDDADSRYMLATQSIYAHMPELQQWESLAGYLLHDHSSIIADSDDSDVSLAVQGTYKLAEGEETILLDVLYFAVRMYLTTVLDLAKEKKGRSNATKDTIKQKQETAAENLSTIIPRLLSRYGSSPRAATSILRLEQLLDADLISDLQGGEATYSRLLDDIDKQFSSHSDRKVLAEASRALRVARGFEQTKEATDQKVLGIWTETIASLRTLLKGKRIEGRGLIERYVLRELLNVCMRAGNLAAIADCSDVLEEKFPKQGKKQNTSSWENGTPLDLLLTLLSRGVPDDDTTDACGEVEDQVTVAVITTLSLYFRWKVASLIKAIESNDEATLSTEAIANLNVKRNTFTDALTPIITNRLALDPVRLTASHTVLDIYTLFATTKHRHPKSGGDLDEDIAGSIAFLTIPISSDLLTAIMQTHDRLERSFARRTHRKILRSKPSRRSTSRATTAEPDAAATQQEIEKPPEDSDDEDAKGAHDDDASSSEDDGDANADLEGGGKEAKKQAALVAEQSLCEMASKIVLAVFGGVISPLQKEREVKARLMLNKGKLGKSFAGVVGYLDRLDEGKKKSKKGAGKKGQADARGGKAKSREIVTPEPEMMEVEGDEIEDDEDDEELRGREGDEVEREIVAEEEDEREEEQERREREGDEDGEEPGEDEDMMGD